MRRYTVLCSGRTPKRDLTERDARAYAKELRRTVSHEQYITIEIVKQETARTLDETLREMRGDK